MNVGLAMVLKAHRQSTEKTWLILQDVFPITIDNVKLVMLVVLAKALALQCTKLCQIDLRKCLRTGLYLRKVF